MNEFLEQFLLESRELVAQATDDLMALEDQPGDRERLDGAFRAFHTLKGAAGIVEFAAMARLLHAAEDIFTSLRSSGAPITPNILDECLACLDLVLHWLDAMQTNGEAPSIADSDADAMIARLLGSPDVEESVQVSQESSRWLERLRVNAGSHFAAARTALRYLPPPDAFFQGVDPMTVIAALPRLMAVDVVLADPDASLETMDPFSCGLEISALTGASTADVRTALLHAAGKMEIRELAPATVAGSEQDFQSKAMALLEAQLLLLREPRDDGLAGRLAAAGRTAINSLLSLGRAGIAAEVEKAAGAAQGGGSAEPLIAAIERALANIETPERHKNAGPAATVSSRALRIDMDRIDALVKLTGELIVVKNAIGHAAKLLQDNADASATAAILRDQHALFERLATELQGAVLRIRVLPLRSVFRRFPRLVREIAGSVGKTARLITEGEATEADATIVDAIFEPLLHVLRNAVDHGIESPEQRASAGKPAMGTVVLRALRDVDTVRIEVEDDGGGIDVGQVRAVARARGIATEEALMAMTDAEAANLIFAAGFSTAAAVTDLSGRGVGMDSVRTAVERLGGRVTLASEPGRGTTVGLVLPFSLMMTRVMSVEVAGQAFGLPLDSVLETTIISRDLIVPVGAGQAFVLRDRTVPLLNLADTLGVSRDVTDQRQAKIVVVLAAGNIGAIEVDRLGERMDVMLTPMDGLLGSMRGIAGTTLLGDGRVLIVLDIQEMFV